MIFVYSATPRTSIEPKTMMMVAADWWAELTAQILVRINLRLSIVV